MDTGQPFRGSNARRANHPDIFFTHTRTSSKDQVAPRHTETLTTTPWLRSGALKDYYFKRKAGQPGLSAGQNFLVSETAKTAPLRFIAKETRRERGNENPTPTPSEYPRLTRMRQYRDARSTKLQQ